MIPWALAANQRSWWRVIAVTVVAPVIGATVAGREGGPGRVEDGAGSTAGAAAAGDTCPEWAVSSRVHDPLDLTGGLTGGAHWRGSLEGLLVVTWA